MIYFEDASKKQLLQIALHEDCDIKYKYAACRELELRKWREDMTETLVRLWGLGKTAFEISIELGVAEYTVKQKLTEFGLYKKRVN